MSELDKKVEEILTNGAKYYEGAGKIFFSFDDVIHPIKQAFIDDGWLQPPNMDAYLTAAFDAFIKAGGDEKDFVLMSRKDWNVNSKLAGVMTREEWEKQAKAEGWHKECPPKITDGTIYPLVWAKAHGYKTGQEWYDRFTAEIEKQIPYTPSRDANIDDGRVLYTPSVRDAAKKASGINQ